MERLLSHVDPRGVLTLTLNRTELHNAFDDLLVAELSRALEAASQDPDVRIVVLAGAGKSFSAGADLNWMRRMAGAGEEENLRDALALATLMRTLNYLDRPTVARVQGPALGGGVGLVACCDIAIAADSARFGLTEARLGLAPAVISPYVQRRIGEGRARHWFLTGEPFDAASALAAGLVHAVVPAAELDTAIEASCQAILRCGPEAVRACKRLVAENAGHDPETQARIDQRTAELIARLRVSAEGQEGLSAFLDKRPPEWRTET